MKIEKSHGSWKEITTKTIKVTGFYDNDPFRESVLEWIESLKRINQYKKHRKVCGCCHINWEKIEGRIYFVSTNLGNKIICGKCWKDIS